MRTRVAPIEAGFRQSVRLWAFSLFLGLCAISMVWAGVTILGLTDPSSATATAREIAKAMIIAPVLGLLAVAAFTEPEDNESES